MIANAGAKRTGYDCWANLYNLSRHCSQSTTTNAIENAPPIHEFCSREYRTPAKFKKLSLCAVWKLDVRPILPLGLLLHTAEYDGFPFALIEAMSMSPFRTTSVPSEFSLPVHLSSKD